MCLVHTYWEDLQHVMEGGGMLLYWKTPKKSVQGYRVSAAWRHTAELVQIYCNNQVDLKVLVFEGKANRDMDVVQNVRWKTAESLRL